MDISRRTYLRNGVSFIILIIMFAFGFLFGVNFIRPQDRMSIVVTSNAAKSTKTMVRIPDDLAFPGYNGTHLWSLRLADENYFRLARLVPCRVVQYGGGPKIDTIDSCDHSAEREYSVENSVWAQKWIYEHQNPKNCSNKRFAIIQNYAWSGYGSTVHQVAWAFGMALAQDRIAIYQTPGNWIYTDCPLATLDCTFLPITSCPMPTNVDGNQTIRIKANFGYWKNQIHHPVFKNRTFNWYRAQLIFYLMRLKPESLAYAQNIVAKFFQPPSLDLHHPYIALYIRRSDKIQFREMSRSYSMKEYFDLFDSDARRANISTVYINSEDERVFKEFQDQNTAMQNYYKLLSIKTTRNAVFRTFVHWPKERRALIAMEFLSDLYIEANADLHVGTLSSNWCRLVDEFRLTLGKYIPYYTPEQKYLLDGRRKRK